MTNSTRNKPISTKYIANYLNSCLCRETEIAAYAKLSSNAITLSVPTNILADASAYSPEAFKQEIV
jgi:hypothetical protein